MSYQQYVARSVYSGIRRLSPDAALQLLKHARRQRVERRESGMESPQSGSIRKASAEQVKE